MVYEVRAYLFEKEKSNKLKAFFFKKKNLKGFCQNLLEKKKTQIHKLRKHYT